MTKAELLTELANVPDHAELYTPDGLPIATVTIVSDVFGPAVYLSDEYLCELCGESAGEGGAVCPACKETR